MNTSTPVHTVVQALARIDAFAGSAAEFLLTVHESLLDPVGLNMALITDRILAKGWEPDGFIVHEDCRVLRYKEFNSAPICEPL